MDHLEARLREWRKFHPARVGMQVATMSSFILLKPLQRCCCALALLDLEMWSLVLVKMISFDDLQLKRRQTETIHSFSAWSVEHQSTQLNIHTTNVLKRTTYTTC